MEETQETMKVAGSQLSVERLFRFVLLGYAWLFLAAVVVEVYFAGLMLFDQVGGHGLHEDTGWILAWSGVFFLALPGLARAGYPTVVVGVVLALTTFAQPFLPSVDGSPLIAALHPVNAILMVVLPILLIRRGTVLVRQEREAGRPSFTDERGQSVPVGAD